METKIKNPLVFPVVGAKDKIDNYGMTLRDYFANSASIVIPIKEQNRGFRVDEDYVNWAKECYRRADAMLRVRLEDQS